ncbi:MAG: DUF3365 domain-containing protein [Magnetococcales bacterium]|nr:DUF3365 domain-containing protein [Magnetococcales bacterium]
MLLLLLSWNIHQEQEQTRALAINAARASFDKDQAFRLWATSHGGVYVQTNERTPPNPYLESIPERDIVTPSGRRLTLMNPAYMVRQLMEEYPGLYGIRGRITSLKPLNPNNASDPWESTALHAFETGVQEVLEFTEIDRQPVLRLMRPMYVKEGCLKCHPHQGYEVGDVRGGVGVIVPLHEYLVLEKRTTKTMILTHVCLWLIGLVVLIIIDRFFWRYRQEHEQWKESLLERETRLRLTIEYALDAIIIMDEHGIVTDLNPAAEALFGYSRAQLMGKDLADIIIPPEFREAHRQGLRRRVQEQENGQRRFQRKIDLLGLRADGQLLDLEVGFFDVRMTGKIYFSAFMHDITQKKQLLKSLKETLDVAESANRTKSEFLANMSHEIRTPMNTIIGMTDLILNTPSISKEEQFSHLEIVQQSSQSLLELINSILDLSKIEAGMIFLERILFDLPGQVEKACNSLAIKAHRKNLELSCRIAPQIPDALLGDPLRLKQILVNLINNAIKFTENGEVVLDISLASSDLGADSATASQDVVRLHFSVVDTGIGIPPEKQSLIFERFTQADGTTSRKYGGSGLGLTICRHLVTMMDGNMFVESTQGVGSSFHFILPFTLAPTPISETVTAQESEEQRARRGMDSLSGIHVLVCDSHATGRGIVTGILVNAGAKVTEAADLDSLRTGLAENKESQDPCTLLILDYGLMAKKVLADPITWDHPCIREGRILLLLPHHISLEEVKRIDGSPSLRVLHKPIWKFRLLKAIHQMLNRESVISKPTDATLMRRPMLSLDILLAEDDPNHQTVATLILEQAGHKVTAVDNGLQAIETLERRAYDLVLMDLQMPKLNGIEATRQIRAANPLQLLNPLVPIIALTGRSLNDEEQTCLAAGMDAYLRKPYRAAELLAVISEVIRRRQIRQHQDVRSGLAVLKAVAVDADILADKRQAFVSNHLAHLEALREAVSSREEIVVSRISTLLVNQAREIGAGKVSVQGMHLRGSVEQKRWKEAETALEKLQAACQEAQQAIMEE